MGIEPINLPGPACILSTGLVRHLACACLGALHVLKVIHSSVWASMFLCMLSALPPEPSLTSFPAYLLVAWHLMLQLHSFCLVVLLD